MKKASLVIKEIQEGTYSDVLKEVYIDESRIENNLKDMYQQLKIYFTLWRSRN